VTRPLGEEDCLAALLAGMSLAAEYLAKNDGSKLITPQFVASAIHREGKRRGFIAGKIDAMIEDRNQERNSES
jgi:hypothetical protein